jgi:hypothetical protein
MVLADLSEKKLVNCGEALVELQILIASLFLI